MEKNSSTSDTNFSGDSVSSFKIYIPIFILTIATFMEVLDTTIANVALPRIAGDLSVSPNDAAWIIGAYLVANAAILPISGWLATYFGRKRYYMACVFLFVISSLLCGLATDLSTLIFFRVIQGLSGGGLAPTEQAIIADTIPAAHLGRAFSIYGFGLAVAPVLGPTFGGWITDTFSWHWIFFINVPIGIVSLLLVWFFVHESEAAKKAHKKMREEGFKIDWVGISLFVLGIAALEVVLEKGPREGWFESDFILVFSIAAFLCLIIGITWEWYQDHPAVDIEMFRHRHFTGAFILIFAVGLVAYGSTFLLPYMAQTLLDYNATNAGLLLMPGAIVLMIMIPVVGYLIDKIDARKIILFGLIASALAMWQMSTINLDVEFYDLALARALQSFALAFLAISINTAAYYDIPNEKANNASALLNLSRNVGASLGIALTTTLLTQRTQVHVNNLSYHASDYNPNFTESINRLIQALKEQGLAAFQAKNLSYEIMWDTLVKQASMQAVLDAFQTFMILFLSVIPFVFLLKAKRNNNFND
jgi:MFS transporter, DHA2 family, multidrug resistance protein